MKPNRALDRYCAIYYRNIISSIFHFLVGILFLVCSRRIPLRHRANEEQTAQPSNKIGSEANDRLGFKFAPSYQSLLFSHDLTTNIPHCSCRTMGDAL